MQTKGLIKGEIIVINLNQYISTQFCRAIILLVFYSWHAGASDTWPLNTHHKGFQGLPVSPFTIPYNIMPQELQLRVGIYILIILSRCNDSILGEKAGDRRKKVMSSVGAGALTPLEQMRTAHRRGGGMAHEEPESFGGHLDSMEANLCEGEPLLSEEVANYIAVDFWDGTGPGGVPPNDIARVFRSAENASLFGRRMKPWANISILEGDGDQEVGVRELATGSRRKRVVHVESGTTGTFFKVYEEVGGVSHSAWGFRGGNRSAGDEDFESFTKDLVAGLENGELGMEKSLARAREVSLNKFNEGLDAGTLFLHGILAGLSLSTVLTAWMAPSLTSFIAAYEFQSGEFRRAMFMICTLALMGTEDRLARARAKQEQWQRLTWFRRVELKVSVFLYAGCLVSTLVCSVADTAIANAQGHISDFWYDSALEDPEFRGKVSLWHTFNFMRFVFAWSGWFLVCTRVRRAFVFGEVIRMGLRGQRDNLADAHERISRLNCRKLDPLPSKELQELGESLKRALAHIERIMNLQNKR